MATIPTLRRKILRAFSIVVLLYAGLGVVLVISVLLASNTTPRVQHLNYDSILASTQMREAWNALDRPERFPEHQNIFWIQQFEKALIFNENNISQPGEVEIVKNIKNEWQKYKTDLNSHSIVQFNKLNKLLTDLVQVNEKGMFRLVEQNTTISSRVLWGAILYFLVTLILSILLADNLAQRLSRPLKNIAEVLQRRPKIGRKLKLLEPTNLELFILSNELKRLWDRVVESEKVNITEVLQQKSKLETVLESVEDALLVVSTSGIVSHSNQYLLALIELPSELVQGHLWNDLPTLNENYIKLRAITKEDIVEEQEIGLRLQITIRQFSVRSRKILSSGGVPIGSLYLLHDITEKRQKEHFRSDFINLLSHEIKSPLQSLGAASKFLKSQKKILPESIIPYVETISEDVERIQAVANEFIQVTQTNSKIMKMKLETITLSQLLPEWIKPFNIIAKDHDIQLKYLQEGSQLILARLDIVKFPWVISNLLSNAIRFSPTKSIVEILLTDRNGFVEIKVTDCGPGISEEDQKRMFEPFYQSPMITNSGKKGLFGAGLTITKEVVEAHEGRIEYYSRNPSGSSFRILIPFPPQNYS